MDIVNIFGIELANIIDLEPSICRGFIRKSIKKEFNGEYVNLTYDNLKKVFNNSLKNKLQELDYDSDKIIEDLNKKLEILKSVLTLAYV
ncbi:MAG: hypothetical protein GY870_17800 [archaeon]|nr:hypothetical protein [archaeon]